MRRTTVAVMAMGLVASCASPAADGPASYGDDDGGVATTAAGGSPAPSSTAGGSSGGGGAPVTRPAPRSGGGGGPSPTTAKQDPIVIASRSGPGGFAPVVLGQRSPATRISLDVMAQAGAAPASSVLSHMRSALADASGKPVSLLGPNLVPGSAQSWSSAELRELADQSGRAVQGGSQAALRVLYLHGDLEGDRSVLGVAVRGDVLAVFSDVIAESTSPLLSSGEIFDAVSMHELGHLLGLVDLVLSTGRQDPEHPGHSSNRGSVMFWAVESDLISQVLGGSPPNEFDADDRADLATIRGTN